MLATFIEAVPGVLTRIHKRHAGEQITPVDYKMLWAATTQAGNEPVTTNEGGLDPTFRLAARRVGNGNLWRVTKEQNVFTNDPWIAERMPFRYKVLQDLGTMDEPTMVQTLQAADKSVRLMGHISGLTRG